MKNKLQLKSLISSRCIHTEIDKQLVKEEYIEIKPIDRLFEVLNIDRTKNRKVMRFASTELKINRYMENIYIVVMDLNNMDMFLGYDWLVKHNTEVNWNKETIQFIRCMREYKT